MLRRKPMKRRKPIIRGYEKPFGRGKFLSSDQIEDGKDAVPREVLAIISGMSVPVPNDFSVRRRVLLNFWAREKRQRIWNLGKDKWPKELVDQIRSEVLTEREHETPNLWDFEAVALYCWVWLVALDPDGGKNAPFASYLMRDLKAGPPSRVDVLSERGQ